jgi:hypothetical protein
LPSLFIPNAFADALPAVQIQAVDPASVPGELLERLESTAVRATLDFLLRTRAMDRYRTFERALDCVDRGIHKAL